MTQAQFFSLLSFHAPKQLSHYLALGVVGVDVVVVVVVVFVVGVGGGSFAILVGVVLVLEWLFLLWLLEYGLEIKIAKVQWLPCANLCTTGCSVNE